jgi:HAD superfamily hydrolase (TIGR01509 family)
MAFDAIIFDCDGTLVDSEPLSNQVIVEYASEFGIQLTLDEALARFKGGKMTDCIAHLEALRGQSLPSSFVPELRRRKAAALASQLKPIAGALDLVRSLSIPFCVASSSPRQQIELSLAVTGLLPYFEGRIFSSYELGAWKPDPSLFLHAARSLGVDAARCAVIEDSLPGIQAGVAAGMTVFALIDTSSCQPVPSCVRAVANLSELNKLLG